MTITDITDDDAYRQLAERALRTACATAEIEVGDIAWRKRDTDRPYAWLCFAIDPESEEHETPRTGPTAAEHLAQVDPNGIMGEAGQRIDVQPFLIELADEASLGSDLANLTSPWADGLAVARVRFNYERSTS